MASNATRQRASAARRARPATPTGKRAATPTGKRAATRTGKRAATRTGKRAATKGAKKVAKAVSGDGASLARAPKRVAGAAARRVAKLALRRALRSGTRAIRFAAGRAAVAGRSAVDASASRRLPIQLAIDVAVPIGVAWEQWRSWGSLPEGVHRIEDVQREGDTLLGHTAGPRPVDWEAEILDERPDESFAWRSVQATDCAGLATFHRISERLTRIELDLDVLPTNTSQALTFALHMAHHHAEADLRRFKAHVEFINPDAYEAENGRGGTNGRGNGGKGRGNGGTRKASATTRRVKPAEA